MNCVRGLVHELPERDHVERFGESQTGDHPDIESTSPLVPEMRLILLPTRVSPLLKVRRSENCPEILLYIIPPVDEREVRLILLLKVFQSVGVRAPVVVEFAIAIPNTPEILL